MSAPTSELDRVHGIDERIAVDNLELGTRVLYEVVSEFCERP
jgi:acetylornithine deacetylase/succinyl-diaminopimelate desuccinylase-like protein